MNRLSTSNEFIAPEKNEMMANILIIDDDKEICEVITEALERYGCHADSANLLESGIKKVREEDFDAVLLDVQMPDGNGLDYIPQIRQAPSAPEVIIMTGYADVDGAELAIKNGAWDYLKKPCSHNKLMLPIMRVIQYRKETRKAKTAPVALKLDGIVGSSFVMKNCHDTLAQAAGCDASTLILGETGTGKELFARAIHANSHRSKRPFVVVDCASLPETLAEAILFGHVKGAYTGASDTSAGLIREADGGTLFLDEIGELPLSLQKVFLRVLQEQRYRPVGGKKEVLSRFRLIAATNRNLDSLSQQRRFRSDLLYRIKTISLLLPALRDRKSDIVDIARYHLDVICSRYNTGPKGLSPEFLETLADHDWPGNVRELVRVIEAAVASAGDAQILFRKHLPENIRIAAIRFKFRSEKEDTASNDSPEVSLPTLKSYRNEQLSQMEKRYLRKLLAVSGTDPSQACRIANISRSRFYGLMKKHNLNTRQ